jgi:hypothetical protein
MTTAVQRRRGTTSQHSTFTGLEGEITVDTTKDTIVVHDGSTAGGIPILREDFTNGKVSGLGSINGADTANDDQFLIFDTSTSSFKKISRAELNNAIEQDPIAVLTVAAGTVSAPSITTTGDTNTGIFFPAADTIAFTEGGVESMRITSAGNVGIGTTGPNDKLEVSGVLRLSNGVTNTITATRPNASGDTFTIRHGTGTDTAIVFSSSNSTVENAVKMRSWNGTQYNEFGVFGTGSSGYVYASIGGTERMRIDSAGNVGIGTSSPVNKLQVNGSLGRNAPVTKTGNFTLADTENWLICNGTGTITVTFPAASSWTGREVMIKTIAAFTVISASSNVVPLAGGSAGTAILAATAGAWATLVSDGTNWIIMQA